MGISSSVPVTVLSRTSVQEKAPALRCAPYPSARSPSVEEMNFTKAAERLFISQQALSSHIGRLEEEYGVQLFQRRPTLQLTQEGKEMLFYSKQILDDEAKMRTAFSHISAHCRGTLKIGLSRLRSAAFLPPGLPLAPVWPGFGTGYLYGLS